MTYCLHIFGLSVTITKLLVLCEYVRSWYDNDMSAVLGGLEDTCYVVFVYDNFSVCVIRIGGPHVCDICPENDKFWCKGSWNGGHTC